MDFIKKQSAGVWATLITLLFAMISFIIYNVNINAEGYFENAAVPYATRYAVIAILLLLAAVVIVQFKIQGMSGKIALILADAIRIISPALFVAAAITLVSARVEGFAFIYFSNEEVLQEVQTAANLSSSTGALAAIIAFIITAIAGMTAAFLGLKKKGA